MKLVALAALLALPACPAPDPAASIDSLVFVAPVLFDRFHLQATTIAVGGTTELALWYDEPTPAPAMRHELDFPYVAEDGGGPAVLVTGTHDATVSLRAATAGSNDVVIRDPEDDRPIDSDQVTATKLATIEIAAARPDSSLPLTATFMTGTRHLGIELFAANRERLVDTSLTVSTGYMEAWDQVELALPTPGQYPLTVMSAGQTRSATITAVDHVDQIVPYSQPPSISPQGGALLCFDALASGWSVADVTWQFLVNDEPTSGASEPNCVGVWPPAQIGSVVVQATAGGATTTITLPIGEAR